MFGFGKKDDAQPTQPSKTGRKLAALAVAGALTATAGLATQTQEAPKQSDDTSTFQVTIEGGKPLTNNEQSLAMVDQAPATDIPPIVSGESNVVERSDTSEEGVEVDPITGLPVNAADQPAIVTNLDGSTETIMSDQVDPGDPDQLVAVSGGVQAQNPDVTPENIGNFGG